MVRGSFQNLKSPSRKGVLVRVQPSAQNRFNELQRFSDERCGAPEARLCLVCACSRFGLGVRRCLEGSDEHVLSRNGVCKRPAAVMSSGGDASSPWIRGLTGAWVKPSLRSPGWPRILGRAEDLNLMSAPP